MRKYKLSAATLVTAAFAFAANYACAQEFSARLNGFNEVGDLNNETGAILSDGSGAVSLQLNEKTGSIAYTLVYSNVGMTPPLTGTVTQAHIHFGKSRDAGGILVYFCANITLPATFTGPTPPACPQNSGTVKGTFTAANVQAIPGQNVSAGDFDALVDAIASKTAYANVHTTGLPLGEIRGQCRSERREYQEQR